MTDQEREAVFQEGYAVGVADGKTGAFGQAEINRLQNRVDELEGHSDGCCGGEHAE